MRRFVIFGGSFQPPPVIISVTNTFTTGGTVIVSGSGFFQASGGTISPTASANIGGTVTNLTVTFVSATQINCTLAAGSYAAGTYAITVFNPDGQLVTANLFMITTVTTPQTQFGADIVSQYKADTVSSSPVGSISDQVGSNTLTSSGTNRPTWTSTDSDFGGHASIAHSAAASQYLSTSSFTLTGSGIVYVYFIGKITGSQASTQYPAWFQAGDIALRHNASDFIDAFASGTTAADTQSEFNKVMIAYAGVDLAHVTCRVNHQTEASAASTDSCYTGAIFAVGDRSGANFLDGKWTEIFVVKRKPTNADDLAMVVYANAQYSILPNPMFTEATDIPALTASAGFRIKGNNFLPSATTSVNIGGTVTNLTTTYVSATQLDCTGFPSTAAGASFTLTIDNGTGQTVTIDNQTAPGLNVTSAVNPMTSEQLNCVAWYEFNSDRVTAAAGGTIVNGGKVNAITDLSFNSADMTQTTSANQPTWLASDSGVNNRPALVGDGSAAFMSSPGILRITGASGLWIVAVAKQVSTSGTQYLVLHNSTDFAIRYGTGQPVAFVSGTTATWGSVLSGAHEVLGKIDGTHLGIDTDNGTEVTTSATNTPNLGSVLTLFERASTQFFNGNLYMLAVFKSLPSLTNIRSYCQSRFGTP